MISTSAHPATAGELDAGDIDGAADTGRLGLTPLFGIFVGLVVSVPLWAAIIQGARLVFR